MDHTQSLCTRNCPRGSANDRRSTYLQPFKSDMSKTSTANKTSRKENVQLTAGSPVETAKNDGFSAREDAYLAQDENGVLQTALAKVSKPFCVGLLQTRVLLDSGSSRSWITMKLARKLNLRLTEDDQICINRFMGDDQPFRVKTKSTMLEFVFRNQRFLVTVSVMEQGNVIVKNITRVPMPKSQVMNKCKGLQLADTLPTAYEQVEIDLLIDSDYYFELTTGKCRAIDKGLFLVGSPFGWILGGRVKNFSKTGYELFGQRIGQPVMTFENIPTLSAYSDDYCQRVKSSNEVSNFWELETIGIKDCPYLSDDDHAVERFEKTVKFVEGRNQVKWPLKSHASALPDNRILAHGRPKSSLRRLSARPDLMKKYCDILDDQIKKSVIEKVPFPGNRANDNVLVHYISHHPVETPQKTTKKVRIVYDASARQGQKPSLNDVLHRGPLILEDLVGMIIRFRTEPIAIVTDIEKPFLQIGLQEPDRDLTRFLWLKDQSRADVTNNVQEMRFKRVTFGLKGVPICWESQYGTIRRIMTTIHQGRS